jgi:DNA-binding transcriptional MocR family regulator
LDLSVVEDRIWSFLHEGHLDPLGAYAPEHTYVVDGLSKRVAPGLTVGFLVAPKGRVEQVAAALRSGAWTASRFALEAAVRWIADGTVDHLVRAKRADAARRQALVAEHLTGFSVRADPCAYYAWWELPYAWRADAFAAAADRGIAITPGSAFAVGGAYRRLQGAALSGTGAAPGGWHAQSHEGLLDTRAQDCVRLGLASTAPQELAGALRTLAGIARTRS